MKSQTYANIEVIVVDDGSTDGTRAAVEKFTGVRYHYQPNRGPAAARNAGLRLSSGDYLAFLDADDLWEPDMLASCVHLLETRPGIGAVHVNWLPIDAAGNLIRERSGWQPWRGDIFERLLVHIPFNTSSVVWRRECWDRIGGFDETPEMNDDWINWLRIARLGCKFECIERPLVYRRMHEASIVHRQGDRIIHWRLNALEKICDEFDIPEPLRLRAYAEVYWIGTTVALREQRCEDAVKYFRQAVIRNPDLLAERSTYYALAHGGARAETSGELDLEKGAATIERLLTELFSTHHLPQCLVCSERQVWSKAMFSLAQMAYSTGSEETRKARHYLWRSLQASPAPLCIVENLPWLLRILLGRQTIESTRRLVALLPMNRGFEHAQG